MAISQQSVLKFFGGQIEKPAEKRTPAVDENSTVSLKNFKYDKRRAEKNIPSPMD